jgi:hypothetical protein
MVSFPLAFTPIKHLGFPLALSLSLLPFRVTCPAYLILLHFIILMKLGRSTSYEAPRYAVFSTLLPLHHSSSKYPPQHPVLKHPQSMFLPQRHRSIKSHRQYYRHVYSNFYFSTQQTNRPTIRHQMAANINRVHSALKFLLNQMSTFCRSQVSEL